MQTRFARLLAVLVAVACLVTIAVRSDAPPARAAAPQGVGRAKRVLLISLDGLDARYLLRRDEYGLKIPTLRRLLAGGAWARGGVVSVYPSVTYPAHTTMVTGAVPRRHGIYGNEVFEPPPAPQLGSLHWFARDIQADTLWAAAARRGLTSALVSWPVATGAGDFNVPEVWRRGTSPGDDLHATLAEIVANTRPRGLVEEVAAHDPQLYRQVTKDEGDDMRTRFAEYIIKEKRPALMLVHLFDFDHFQHDFAPFTPEAFAILEKSDAYLARLLDACERAGTLAETAVYVVSDHGFRPISKQIQANVILERAGLLKLREERDAEGRTRTVAGEWRALAYPTSGSCFVILRERKDGDAFKKALDAFRAYAGQEDGGTRPRGAGILRIIYAEHLAKMGSNPRAAFALEAAEGYGFDKKLTGEPVTPAKGGTHGYLPTLPGYRASFVAYGAGITPRADIGTIQMLDIAPTVAQALGLKLRDADGRPLKAVSGKQ